MEENNNILDKYVGQKIKERRKILSLTQAELADIIGISHQQVQRYESGENTISMSRMLEIANCLNIKLDYFYENAPLQQTAGKKITTGIITKDSGRPIRLLLVEDVSSDELLFRKAVEQSDIYATLNVIQNPLQVIPFLQDSYAQNSQNMPDLVILDINMPRMNGLMLLKAIKENASLKMLPVIMLTNSVRSKDMEEAYINHANGFVQKNSDLMAFYNDVDLILKYWSRAVILPSAA